ncbi:MAG TPA: zf-HC2 domain-containing protein [Actinomycetota bacterium]|nr:zf-HC2 domain-containing protein [Actinomycetota bacterium]
MTPVTCAEVAELAAELALGTLPGDQRAAVLAHLDGCGECRRLVKELADTADVLLLLAPAVEPPAGFARRVARGLRPPRSSRWRPAVAAAAVALVVGLALGLLPGRIGAGPVALVRVASFVPARGETLSGQVYSRADRPAWLFMTVRDTGTMETYTCELELKDGRHVKIGSFVVHNGSGSWGRTLDVSAGKIESVRLLDAGGAIVASAH